MAQINPFLRFNDGKCSEAMNFYKTIFGGELELMTVADTPMSKDMAKDKQKLIMHSTLKKGNWVLIGSDMMRDKAVVGDNVGVSVECESEKEINDVFAKLSKGGDVFMAPEETFWGAIFGLVTDKYGVEWMLNFSKKAQK